MSDWLTEVARELREVQARADAALSEGLPPWKAGLVRRHAEYIDRAFERDWLGLEPEAKERGKKR